MALRLMVLALAGMLAFSMARAQTAAEVPVVGYLSLGSAVNPAVYADQMRKFGYEEGRNLKTVYKLAGGRHDALFPLARELVAARVNVIVAVGDEAITAAQMATREIPIVMLACDAVVTGYVANLVRPGGNTTGVTCLTVELAAKRVEYLRELVSGLSRFAVLYNPFNVSKPYDFGLTRAAGERLGLQVEGHTVREPEDIEQVFKTMREARPDGLLVLTEAFTVMNAKRIAELANGLRLPSMNAFREGVDAGGLLSYGPNLSEMSTMATAFVPKILRGARPGDLPVEQPTHFELVVNRRAAAAIGLTIPPAILARASEVLD